MKKLEWLLYIWWNVIMFIEIYTTNTLVWHRNYGVYFNYRMLYKVKKFDVLGKAKDKH